MLGMVKLNVESFLEAGGKTLKRWPVAAGIRMANHAHWHCWCGELSKVAAGTCFVSGEMRRVGIICAFMTRIARK
jgi:hypothetical protein